MTTRPNDAKPGGILSVADLSVGRRRLRITGADCAAFLHGQCTNDIHRLHTGESQYATFLNAKGKMRGEGHIIRLEDAFLLEVNTGLRESLEKFIITEDVTIEDMSDAFRCYLAMDHAPSVGTQFAHPLGVGVITAEVLPVTVSAEDFETRRIEAGIPKWGVDMDENTIPIEAGLERRAINYDKGCYIGQETVARIKTYGHVNRHLVQFSVLGEQLPVVSEKIFAGDKEAGHITSATHSNRLGKMLALGYVRREFARAGTALRAGTLTLEVTRVCGE